MNEHASLERLVLDWMADEASVGRQDALIDSILATTARQRPLPRWRAFLAERPMHTQTRAVVGSPTYRVALIALVIGGLGLVALAGALLLLRPGLPADDWSGYRGNSAHTGAAGSGPTGNPAVKWTVSTGAAISGNLSIAGDLVLVPSDDGVLHALSLGSGTERWSAAQGTTITGPTVADGVVYFTDGSDTVHALTLADGTERWATPLRASGASVAALGDGRVYLGTRDGQLVALDAASGKEQWRTQVSSDGQLVLTPAFDGGVVYVTSRGTGLVAYRASDGARLWVVEAAGTDPGTPVVTQGIVWVGVSGDTGEGSLRAVDARTGTPLWGNPAPLFAPSVEAGLALSGSTSGYLIAMDPATGTEAWRYLAGGTIRAPAIAGRTAYVAADDQREVVALDAATGRVYWTLPMTASNSCCIAAARGLLFVGLMDGRVLAITGDGTAIVPQEPSFAVATPAPTTEPPTGSAAPALTDPFTVRSTIDPTTLGIGRPISIAFAPDGELYVSDATDHVTRVAADGTRVAQWGGTGTEYGQFDFTPASAGGNVHGSLTVGADGTVFVADSDNHRVQAFSPDGTFARSFGGLGSSSGQFTNPFDLVADPDGNVYVFDDGLERLTKFAPDGSVVWIVDGRSDPRLAGHGHTPTFDSQGRLVVSNDDNGLVLYLDPKTGAVLDAFEADGCSLGLDAADTVYVDDCGGGQVLAFDARHAPVGASRSQHLTAPVFGPDGAVAALTTDGAIVLLDVARP
jgi:outer membrane protein assembly factor BamB